MKFLRKWGTLNQHLPMILSKNCLCQSKHPFLKCLKIWVVTWTNRFKVLYNQAKVNLDSFWSIVEIFIFDIFSSVVSLTVLKSNVCVKPLGPLRPHNYELFQSYKTDKQTCLVAYLLHLAVDLSAINLTPDIPIFSATALETSTLGCSSIWSGNPIFFSSMSASVSLFGVGGC